MRWLDLFMLAGLAAPLVCNAAPPSRLVLLVDGVSYSDVRAVQEGVTVKTARGRQAQRQAFQGYFPASRLISTFPSISDTAWAEILGNEPPAGYQRTYFNVAEGSTVSLNGVTGFAEYEHQMTWQMRGGFRRVTSYGSPYRSFKYELNEIIKSFLQSSETTNFYALIHSTDAAQHSWGDIRSMLCLLADRLEELREIYRAREGKELEILILSDHGNNRGGDGKRIPIKKFLRKHGYRVAKSLARPNDIVLPTAGVESWVEIHNAPAETSKLVPLLSRLEGVDLVTARLPDRSNRFIVRSSSGEEAEIEWNVENNSFKYQMRTGDPLGYGPAVEALAEKGAFDRNGFATEEHWTAETLAHRYPLALERIVRAHTGVTQNPAPVLLSLKSGYIHSKWLIKWGLSMVKAGGTHGGLDDASSTGVLLSNFLPTEDTSSRRVAAFFDGFQGRRDYRLEASEVEWASRRKSQRSSDSVRLAGTRSRQSSQ